MQEGKIEPHFLTHFNSAVIRAFEKVDLRLLIFLLLCLNFLSFTLSSNEEAYLPLAKQYMNPGWMPNSFIFNEWPGNRLLFQYVTGFFLRYFEFEPFVFFARMAVFLFIAFPVAAIFKLLKIQNISVIIVFQIYLLHQNYFAREFIFGDFEAKSIAYIFVLTGLYYLLKNKYLLAVLFAVLGSYFHILVGGWFFVLIFIYSFFIQRSFLLLVKESVIYIILLLPFAYYLGTEIAHSGSVINGVNIDWVYVYFRNPHHLAPLSVKEMLPEILSEIAITALLFIATIFIFRKYKGELTRNLFWLNIIVFTLLFAFLGISLVDKKGVLLKFYLFRFAALGCFLMYLYLIIIVKLAVKIKPWIFSLFLLLGFFLIISQGVEFYNDVFRENQKKDYKELVEYIRNKTSASQVFLTLDDYELSFSRVTQRGICVLQICTWRGSKNI